MILLYYWIGNNYFSMMRLEEAVNRNPDWIHLHNGLHIVALLFILAACSQPVDDEPTALDASIEQAKEGLLPEWEAELDEMTRALALTPAEQAPVRAAFEARQDEIVAWFDGPEGSKLLEEEAALREATAEKDLQKVRSLTKTAGPRRRAIENIIKRGDAAVLQALPPAKQDSWRGYELSQALLELMQPLNLTAEQQSSIADNSAAAYQSAANTPNPMAAGYLELEKWVEAEVLTPDQRAAFQPIKDQNKLRTLRWSN